MRRTERVIIRTEEPVTATSSLRTVRSKPRSDIERRLRYGTVEETDEGFKRARRSGDGPRRAERARAA